MSVPPITGAPGAFDRHGLAGEHRLVDGRAPVDDRAIRRHVLSRADHQDLVDHHGFRGHLLVLAQIVHVQVAVRLEL
jgi:hypothetical protein